MTAVRWLGALWNVGPNDTSTLVRRPASNNTGRRDTRQIAQMLDRAQFGVTKS